MDGYKNILNKKNVFILKNYTCLLNGSLTKLISKSLFQWMPEKKNQNFFYHILTVYKVSLNHRHNQDFNTQAISTHPIYV